MMPSVGEPIVAVLVSPPPRRLCVRQPSDGTGRPRHDCEQFTLSGESSAKSRDIEVERRHPVFFVRSPQIQPGTGESPPPWHRLPKYPRACWKLQNHHRRQCNRREAQPAFYMNPNFINPNREEIREE